MEKISLEQFTAEIETSLSNYAESNDIDRLSIKTWVIQALRKFGKNICEKNETVVEVKNSRALLPETFKSLTFAVKVKTKPFTEEETKQLVTERRYIQNEAIWDSLTQTYITDYCTTYVTTEKIYDHTSLPNKFYGCELLALSPNINRDTVDTNCFNLHPYIANNKPNEISLVGRTLSANFKEGFVYLRYNSLPSLEEEIAIPVLSNGAILEYIENNCKWRIAESLIANNKNPLSLNSLYSTWRGLESSLLHAARTESSFYGLGDGSWTRKYYKQNLINRKRLGL